MISASNAVLMVKFWSPVTTIDVTPAPVVWRSLTVFAEIVLATFKVSIVLVVAVNTTAVPPAPVTPSRFRLAMSPVPAVAAAE